MDAPATSFALAPAQRRWLLLALVLANLVGLIAVVVLSNDRYQLVDRVNLAYGIGLPERSQPPMLVIAHRGDPDRYPENTLEAIETAAAGSADGIEFDVHRSADGVWYVIHDRTLERTTDLSGRVDSRTSSEIDQARIDGGLGFRPEHLGLAVPRLETVLDELSDYDGELIVDLYHRESGDAAEVAALLDGRPATLITQGVADIEAIRAVDPELSAIARDWSAAAERDGILLDANVEATVGKVRDAGQPVWTYVDDRYFKDDEEHIIRRAWAADVFAYISKHPEAAAATVARLRVGG